MAPNILETEDNQQAQPVVVPDTRLAQSSDVFNETEAMRLIYARLMSLPKDAQARVLNYLVDRFKVKL